MLRFTAEIDGIERFNRAFNRIEERISDFRFVWPAIAREFYAIEHEQFAGEGARGASGKWAALSPVYAKFKATAFPGQPILRATTSLYESLTSPDALDSIFRMTEDELTLGSKAPYATVHQRGGGRLPARPPISLTESDKRQVQKAIQAELVKFTRDLGFEVGR